MKRSITFALVLMTLTACARPEPQLPEPVVTDRPLTNMSNPASVYCQQNGNQLEIRTAPDGVQSGVCVFPAGNTCDEWAYFREECGPATPTSPIPATTHETNSNDNNSGGDNPGSFMPPGATEVIVNWWGVIKRSEPGAQFDDYFERQDLGQIIRFGIDSIDPTVRSQIEALRDSGKVIHLYGTFLSNVPDYNGSQIQVDRFEVEE